MSYRNAGANPRFVRYILIAKACARFGAIEDEIKSILAILTISFIHDLERECSPFPKGVEKGASPQMVVKKPLSRTVALVVGQCGTGMTALTGFIFGTRDNSIPVNLLAFMAERAGSKKTVTIEGASHAVMISHADAVVELVEQAASAV